MPSRRCLFILLLVLPVVASAQNLDMGERYREIDGLAVRIRTTFADATARSIRETDGTIRTELRNRDATRVLLRLTIAKGQVSIEGLDGGKRPLRRKLTVTPTMDWANALAYRLWRDRDDAAVQKERFDAEIRTVTTYFDEFIAHTVMRPAPKGNYAPTFASVLRRADTSAVVGYMAWYEDEQRLSWSLAEGGSGEVTPAAMGEPWKFQPNAAWANVQLRSFAKSYAEHPAGRAPGSNGRDVVANADGCTGLHWLDGTNLRPCCDMHDWCYEARTPNCTWHSWWWWRGNWSCAACNIKVILCFAIVLRSVDPFTPPPGPSDPWLPDEFECIDLHPGYCPAQCAWCEYYW